MKNLNRRGFLKGLTAGLTVGSLSMSRFMLQNAHAAPIGGRKMLHCFFNGGCDMFIPLQPSGFGPVMDQLRLNRPTLAAPLATSVAGTYFNRLALNGTNYTLHDQMTEFQNLFNRTPKECAILLKAGIESNSGSHEDAQKDHQTGVVRGPDVDESGWIQRIAETSGITDSYRVVDLTGGGIATGATVREAHYRPLALNSIANFGYRQELGQGANGEYGFRMNSALSVIANSGGQPNAADISANWQQLNQSVSVVQAAYTAATINPVRPINPAFPNTRIGQQFRDAFIAFTQLPTSFGYIETGGFDVHENSDPQGQVANTRQGMSALLRDINAALLAFRLNCEGAGIWDDMIVMFSSEFGRTNVQNSTIGLDHGDASLVFLVGGAVNGGIYGQDFTPTELQRPANSIDAQVKIRDVYCDIIQGMSLNPAVVFPGFQRTPMGLIVPA